MNSNAAKAVVENLDDLPYCTGTFSWDKQSTLFYKSNESESEFLNFPATDSQLDGLFNACSAGKIDVGSFGMSFSPCDEGLIGVVEEALFRHHIGTGDTNFTLSGLCVYGPGGSSKAHLEAPSSQIASLIVILPTVHEAGSLILRHRGKEWTFESSKAVGTIPAKAAFIASYSDVEHEVKTIASGYQVMLTYDLVLKKDGKSSSILISEQESVVELKEAFNRLLNNLSFLPDGGFIGFGLNHKYPIVVDSTEMSDIQEGLLGSDAVIKDACEQLSLEVSVKALYHHDEHRRGVLYDSPENIEYQIDDLFDHLDGWTVHFGELCRSKDRTCECDNVDDDAELVWLRRLDDKNLFQFAYLSEDYKRPWTSAEGNVCLVARIPRAEERGLPMPDDASGDERDSPSEKKRRRT